MSFNAQPLWITTIVQMPVIGILNPDSSGGHEIYE